MIGTGLAVTDTWVRLGQAMVFYKSLHFTPVDVRWHVPRSISVLTCPEQSRIVSSDLGDLVGSAEQSFLSMAGYGHLPPGKYVACSPCFRKEPFLDATHRRTFMKVELFAVSQSELSYTELHWAARDFFRRHAPAEEIKTVQTEDGVDIELNGIEIGSYGVRRLDDLGVWCAYGTGLAEPRFEYAVNKGTRRGL